MENSMMESYAKILDCLLLREVIAHLPFADQLTARLVNKDWGNEAYHVIRRSKKCVVKFFALEQITNFILVFPEPLPATSNFYSFATFDVKLLGIALDQLQRFGDAHGAGVQSLKIHVTTRDGFRGKRTWRSEQSSIRQANEEMQAKIKVFLTNFPNLAKLSVEEDEIYRQPHLLFREQNPIPGAELPQFENLEQFDASVNTAFIPLLLNEIVMKCPNLRTGNLTLTQYSPDHSAVREFFQKFGSIDLGKLEIVLNPDPGDLLPELLRSDLKPKYLTILLPRDMFDLHGTIARRNDMISEWIQKLTQSPRMSKLKLVSWEGGPNIPLTLPSEMSYLKELDFGFKTRGCRFFMDLYRPTTFQMTPLISQRQVPYLRKLVIGPRGNQLNPDQIFTNVQELVIDGYLERTGQLPSPIPTTLPTYDWSTKFPNVTKLDMVTGIGALLSPVLTNMLTLTDLKVTFQGLRLYRSIDDNDDNEDSDDNDGMEDLYDRMNGEHYRDRYLFSFNDDLVTVWWDEITGGIRPILKKDSSLEMIVPSNLEHAETDLIDQSDGAARPKLRNLCNLKTLKFANTPSSIVLAVIHLTALKQIPELDKIEILTSTYDAYEPSDACVNVLNTFHGEVEIKSYLVNDDGFN